MAGSMSELNLEELTELLRNRENKKVKKDDEYIITTIEEALTAAKEGNYGVGACLVDADGEVIIRGHNRVFHPKFRSDLHAEMDVMTKFEERFLEVDNLHDYTLYSSLEPCPMCLTRLIISGVKKVYYAAADDYGGMVRKLEHLAPEWVELAQRQEYDFAECSEDLREIALAVFLKTVKVNDKLLEKRSTSLE